MKNRSTWIRLLAFAALLPLAACGVDDEGDLEMTEDDPMMEEPMPPTDGGDMGAPMMLTLEPRNESGVTGDITVRQQGDSASIEVSVTGAEAEGELPAHIHAGTCDSPGEVLTPLNSLQVSAGSGMSVTSVNASDVQGQDRLIQVHDSGGQPIACAEIRDDGMGGTGATGGVDEMGDTMGM